MIRDQTVARIERDRRRREDELLLILLLISGRALHHALVVQQHGGDVRAVIANVIEGNDALGFNGVVPAVVAAMADAHRDAARRLGRITGRDIPAADADMLAALYTAPARRTAAAMTRTLQIATVQAISEAQQDGRPIRRAIRDAFKAAGYARSNSYALDQGAERAVVSAYNAGMLSGAATDTADGGELGIQHLSVLDNNTTEICRERHTLLLRASHPYWSSGGVPSLHWSCRSMLVPVEPPYKESDWLPTIPAAAGFGFGPVPFSAGMVGV